MRNAASRLLVPALLAATVLAAGITAAPAAGAAASGPTPVVRVNQVGYTPGSAKVAFAMLPKAVSGVRFVVIGGHGVVYRGWSSADVGRWNRVFKAVYQLDFSALRHPGRYRVKILTAPAAVSPPFWIASGQALYQRPGEQRRAVLHLGTGRRRCRAVGSGPPASEPHRPPGVRLRRPAL